MKISDAAAISAHYVALKVSLGRRMEEVV